MKLRGASSYVLIAIALIAVVFFVVSLSYHSYKSKLLPMIFSGIIFILAVIQLWQESKQGQKQKKDKKKEHWRPVLAHATWIVGFALGIYLAGFVAAIPVFVLAYTKSHGGKWLGSIIFAVLLAGFCYGAFKYLLNVDLYPGALSSMFFE